MINNIDKELHNLWLATKEDPTIKEDIQNLKQTTQQNSASIEEINQSIQEHAESLSNLDAVNQTQDQSINSLTQTTQTQTEQISNLEQAVDNINTLSEAVETRLATVETTSQTNQTNITNLAQDVERNTSSIQTVNQNLTQAEATLSENTAAITELENGLSELETQNTAQHQSIASDITALSERITTVDARSEVNATKLTDLEPRVETLEQTVEQQTITIEYNDTTLKNMIAQLSTQDSELSARVDEVEAFNQAQETTNTELSTSITNLNTSLTAHYENYQTLKTEVETNQAAITNLQQSASELSTSISNLESEQTSQNTQISNLSTSVETNTTNITDHENRITTLEQGGGGSGGGEQVHYTTIADIENLEAEMLLNEPLFNNGGKERYTANNKLPTGPQTIALTRINPRFNPIYSGKITLYFKGVGVATLEDVVYNLSINGGTAEEKTLDINYDSDLLLYIATIDFSFETSTISNTFEIIFNDTRLANAVLWYVEIETQNPNFMLLNNDTSYKLWSTGIGPTFTYNLHSTHDENYLFGRRDVDISSGLALKTNSRYSYLVSEINTAYPDDYQSFGMNSLNLRHTATTGNNAYVEGFYKQVLTSSYKVIAYRTSTTTPVENIICLDWSPLNYPFAEIRKTYGKFFLITKDLNLKIGKNNTEYGVLPTLNGENLPSGFVHALGAQDTFFWARESLQLPGGYIAVHKTGEMLWFDDKDATYFIRLGLGNNPTYYKQSDENYLNIYSRIGQHLIRRKLKREDSDGKYYPVKYAKIFANCRGIFEYGQTGFAKVNQPVNQILTWQRVDNDEYVEEETTT